MTRIEKHYFRWLLGFVGNNPDYSMVLEDLFNKEFIWLLEYDENLAENGKSLRDDFYNSSLTIQKLVGMYGEIEGPCSVLEMMVKLAMDCEYTIMTDGEHDNTAKWFWIMFDNLGLNTYDDLSYDAEEVDEILETFLHRKYKKNGKGGLFSLRDAKNVDLRCDDIWLQMNQYLIERYG